MDYYSARDLLKDQQSIKLDHNTTLERRGDDRIAVRLHQTDIVTFAPTFTELDSGGWHTRTTMDRMSQFGPVRIDGRNPHWTAGGYVYFDGMRFNRKGKMSAKQPHKPKGYQPVITVSGWSGTTQGRRVHEPFADLTRRDNA